MCVGSTSPMFPLRIPCFRCTNNNNYTSRTTSWFSFRLIFRRKREWKIHSNSKLWQLPYCVSVCGIHLLNATFGLRNENAKQKIPTIAISWIPIPCAAWCSNDDCVRFRTFSIVNSRKRGAQTKGKQTNNILTDGNDYPWKPWRWFGCEPLIFAYHGGQSHFFVRTLSAVGRLFRLASRTLPSISLLAFGNEYCVVARPRILIMYLNIFVNCNSQRFVEFPVSRR